jgi:hypothetical protein
MRRIIVSSTYFAISRLSGVVSVTASPDSSPMMGSLLKTSSALVSV